MKGKKLLTVDDKIEDRAITPEEVESLRANSFPKGVLQSFSQLIVKKWNGHQAVIKQEDAVELMVSKGLDRERIFEEGWLNVEGVFSLSGWDVEYDKPGFNETYPPTFTFRKKRKGR